MTKHGKEEIIAPSTQEDRLCAIARGALDASGTDGPWPVIASWPDGPLQVFAAPAETDGEHMPKTALLFVDFEYHGRGFVAFLGGND